MTNETNPPPMSIVTGQELGNLLKFFSIIPFRGKDFDRKLSRVEELCCTLMSKDYTELIVINNERGHLSHSYPAKILIPERLTVTEQTKTTYTINEVPAAITDNNGRICENRRLETKRLKDLISKARVARCRARFPVPAILFRNKYICRSATLSSAPEIYGRSVLDSFNDKNYSPPTDNVATYDEEDFVEAHIEDPHPAPNTLNIGDSSKMFSHIRNQDIKLLKYFSVKLICDLMLEKKKVKFGMNVTSSEKADKKNRYSEFNILSLPYPGCEFFREYRDRNYCGDGLIYDWNQDFVDAEFGILNCDEVSKRLNLDFKDYRSWDVIKLTQNYIKLMLDFLKKSDSSILIHCISGWDRTPLFISLLRLTLWADGEIHKSLNAIEITYLTVAYDWLLFGHNLNDRLSKGEEILFFCFQFLKFITDDDFSINHEPVPRVDLTAENLHPVQSVVRKISTDSFAPYDDFIIENIPGNGSYKGSLTSLNSNHIRGYDSSPHKNDDTFSLISNGDIESNMKHLNRQIETEEGTKNSILRMSPMKQTNTDSFKSSKKLTDSPPPEMVATLTLNDVLIKSNHFGSPTNHNHEETDIGPNVHSRTKPMEIPNSRDKNGGTEPNSHRNNNGELCRSDSWQFVSESSSLIDNHLLNSYSSPDSISSFTNNKKKNNNSPSPVISQKTLKDPDITANTTRGVRLLEVRSLFNSAYTSNCCANTNPSNGSLLPNFVDITGLFNRTVNI